MAVPAEAALDAAAAHRLITRDGVLDVAGQQVPIVRQSVGERGPVVEHELVVAVFACGALVDRRLERVVLLPTSEDLVLELREARPGVDVWVGHATMLPTGRGRRTGGSGRLSATVVVEREPEVVAVVAGIAGSRRGPIVVVGALDGHGLRGLTVITGPRVASVRI